MKFSVKEDGKRILVIFLASLLMALNIKSFVRTGGLYPGGATGLTILIQRIAEMFLHVAIPYTLVQCDSECCSGLYRVPFYWQEIYPVFLFDDFSYRFLYRYHSRLDDHI